MAELYTTGVNRIVYRSVGFTTGLTITAYIINQALEESGLQTFTEVGRGLYRLDYNFVSLGTYMGVFYENDVAKASGVFRVTTMGGGDATEAKQNTIIGYLDTEVDAIKTVTDKLADTLENDGGTYRFTENALEQAPSGTGGDATEANQNTIITALGVVQADLDNPDQYKGTEHIKL